MSAARDIARALAGGQRPHQLRDGSYLVCCPVPSHGKGRGDSNPSLRIGDGASRLLVHCYAGCDPRDVLDVLRRRGLLIDKPRPPSARNPPPINAEEERERARKLKLAKRIWNEAVPIAGTAGEAYLARRGIALETMPNFCGLRWHSKCPWGKNDTTPCVVARYTDAITGEPRGIWRRPIKQGEKPKALGPMAGCVIRLWPDEAITTALVLGEGVEITLAAALHITHRGTLLQPAWAAGCADSMANFPVLTGIETLTLLVDNDKNGAGQKAAAACAHRWLCAEREVIRLTPHELGADFNDIVMGKRHDRLR